MEKLKDWDKLLEKREKKLKAEQEKRQRIYERKAERYARKIAGLSAAAAKRLMLRRQKRKEEAEIRLKKIIAMREKAATYEEIAQRVGVTRERVRQIGVKVRPDIFNGKVFTVPLVEVTCEACGKKRKLRVTLYKLNRSKKFYCGRDCRRKYTSAEERAEAMNQRKKERYHASPTFRKKLRISSDNWRENLKKDKKKWKAFVAKNKKYQDERLQRIKADPILWEARKKKMREYNRKRHALNKKNPAWVKEQREKQRANYERYYWKKRKSQNSKNK